MVATSINPARILLVEDDANDVELIQMALGPSGIINRLDIVEDGEQALTYLLGADKRSPQLPLPGLVLLDLKLPKINGLEVLRAIRHHPKTARLVVVIVTSSAEDRDLENCYKLGINSYVVKPLDFQQFSNVAHQIGAYWMSVNQIPSSLVSGVFPNT